jgi:uncharacterized protein YcfL
MKKVLFALFASAMLVACGGKTSEEGTTTDSTAVDSSAVVADTTAVVADSTSVVK